MSDTINIQVLNNNTLLKIELYNERKSNALSLKMLDQLINVLNNKIIIKKLKCIVISGANKGPFCSGADLIDIKNLNKENSITTYHEKINNLLDIIRNLKLPVISVIRLYCFGAGFIIATHSDFLLASNDAIFCIPASKLKIKIPNEQIKSLKKRINNNILYEMLSTSRKFNAEEMYNANVIHAYFKRECFEEKVNEFIKSILSVDKNINEYYKKAML